MSRGMRLALGGLGLLPLLVGPTPGAVGSCTGQGENLDQPADLQAYCDEREQLICVRAYERGELPLVARDDCRRAVIERCSQRTFVPGCHPTQRDASACLNALHSRSTLGLTVDEIPECAGLCSIQLADDGPRSIEVPDAGPGGQDAEGGS